MSSEVFVSYAWGGEIENIVNELDEALQERGINMVRDKKDLGFKGLITQFMQRIGEGNAVVVVISDKYLKSHYCMYELLEIHHNSRGNDDFVKRIFPIVLDDASGIFDPLDRLDYSDYWEEKNEKLAKAIEKRGANAFMVVGDDFKIYKRIHDNFGILSQLLANINSLNPALHREGNFKTMYEALSQKLTDNDEKKK